MADVETCDERDDSTDCAERQNSPDGTDNSSSFCDAQKSKANTCLNEDKTPDIQGLPRYVCLATSIEVQGFFVVMVDWNIRGLQHNYLEL